MPIKVYMAAHKVPQGMNEDEKLKYFMNRYGESLGAEVKCHAYGIFEQYFENNPDKNMVDIDITVEAKEFNG